MSGALTDAELGEIRAHLAQVAAGSLNENLGYQRLILRQDAPALFNEVIRLRRELSDTRRDVEAVEIMILTDLP